MALIEHATLDEIKTNILNELDRLLTVGLEDLANGNKFSSAEIARKIGPFITEQIKNIRPPRGGGRKKSQDVDEKSKVKKESKAKVDDKPKTKKEPKAKDDDKPKRAPTLYNQYFSITYAKLKEENAKNEVKIAPKDMMKKVAEMWAEDKATWKPPVIDNEDDDKDENEEEKN